MEQHEDQVEYEPRKGWYEDRLSSMFDEYTDKVDNWLFERRRVEEYGTSDILLWAEHQKLLVEIKNDWRSEFGDIQYFEPYKTLMEYS